MMQQERSPVSAGAPQKAARKRIYELAKEIGVANLELVGKVRGLGIDVKNHMSFLDVDDVRRVKRALAKDRVENQEVKRIKATVIRRRAKQANVDPIAADPDTSAPSVPSEGDVGAQAIGAIQGKDGALDVDQAAAPTASVSESEAGASQEKAITGSDASLKGERPDIESADSNTGIAAIEGGSSSSATASEGANETSTDGDVGEKSSAVASGKDGPKQGPSTTSVHRGAKREIRFAPGYGPNAPARPQHQTTLASRSSTDRSEKEPVSAAEAARMMAPAVSRRPKVVITDLDSRKREDSRRDLFGRDRNRPARGRKRRAVIGRKGVGKKTEITVPADHKRVIRISDAISVGEIGRQMGVKASEVIKKLWANGLTGVTINQTIDADTASLLATEFGYEVEDVTFREEQVIAKTEDSAADLVTRAPVITVMGHVDHGKTSLLDAIRGEDVAAKEAGGITQHIGAYRVTTPGASHAELVFLDTPGHEAFTLMRARGANCTDIVVLVVAADDGVMPQSIEAIEHARAANVPIVVAVNKMDRPDANPDRVKNQLAERNLVPEDWGGDTLFVGVSAITKEGVDTLLENLVLQADLLELTANPQKEASGTVLEARMDRSRGAVASVLVQEGTLRVGDIVVTGKHLGKVRALLDDKGRSRKEAGPSTPVEVLGLGGVPDAGDPLNALADEKAGRQLADFRSGQSRSRDMRSGAGVATYEDILGRIQSGESCELKILVKADVQGSSEAIRDSLTKLGSEKISVNVLSTGVGGIYETDVNLAAASGAILVGFSVRPAGKAAQLAEREGVQIHLYDVIYELLDDVKQWMRGLLPKDRLEKEVGRVEVRQTFTVPKLGVIAGCSVISGKVTRSSQLRLVRENIKIYEGRVGSLRRFKDDVKEVMQGYECGLSIDGYSDIKVGDIIEAYEIEEVTPEL